MFVRVSPASDLRVTEFFFRVPPDSLQFGHTIDGVDRQAEAINLVVHRQLHGRVDITLLLVTANMHLFVLAGIGKAVNQIWVSVKIKNDRLVYREQGIVVTIR
jgi:hypothetical protein